MKFGICCGNKPYENIKIAKSAGFDYVEYNFGGLVNLSDRDFIEYKQNLEDNNISCFAANCFLPGNFKVSSNELDEEAVKEYLEKGMSRGSQIGLKRVVFGSGGARSLPDGQQYNKGFFRLSCFLKSLVVPAAEKYGITVVIEPLRKQETNIINTVKEGGCLAATAESENIAVLADIYHMVNENDSFDNIRELNGLIKHSHISLPIITEASSTRIYPTDPTEYDYKSFLDALIYAGCETCSIEAKCEDFLIEAPRAFKVLKSMC